MNRTLRTIAVVTGALVVAAVASLLVYRALLHAQRPPVVVMTTMVIAARDVPAGTMLTSDDVKVVPWPANNQLATSFATADEVAGRGTIDILHQNEPLTASKLAARGAGAGLPPTIPAGMRAISIRVNEIIGVAGFVTPGSRVDVLVTLDDPSVRTPKREHDARGRQQRPGADRRHAVRPGSSRGTTASRYRPPSSPSWSRRTMRSVWRSRRTRGRST